MKTAQRVGPNQTLTLHSPLHDIDLDCLRRAHAVLNKAGLPEPPFAYVCEHTAKHMCSVNGLPYAPSAEGTLKVGDVTVYVQELQP